MSFSEELEDRLGPYRAEYRSIVNPWLAGGGFAITYPALLVETYHYVKHSCALMEKARLLLGPGRASLAAYLARHEDEERGHEQWLLEDLEVLGIRRRDVEGSFPLPETIQLVGAQHYIIEHMCAAGLLGYVYLMESTPPTERSLTAMEVAGVPSAALSCLRRHGEADIEHSRELRQILDTELVSMEERSAAVVSATVGLSTVNRLMSRLTDGDYIRVSPLLMSQAQVAGAS